MKCGPSLFLVLPTEITENNFNFTFLQGYIFSNPLLKYILNELLPGKFVIKLSPRFDFLSFNLNTERKTPSKVDAAIRLQKSICRLAPGMVRQDDGFSKT